MQIDPTNAWDVEHRLRNQGAIGHNRTTVRSKFTQSRHELRVGRLGRLEGFNAVACSQFRDRASSESSPSTRRCIWSSYHRNHVVMRIQKGLKRGNGRFRRASKDNAHLVNPPKHGMGVFLDDRLNTKPFGLADLLHGQFARCFIESIDKEHAIKVIGAARWQALHRTVYAVAGLGILHFFWMRAGKNDFNEVAVYAALFALLLAWRVQPSKVSGEFRVDDAPLQHVAMPAAGSPLSAALDPRVDEQVVHDQMQAPVGAEDTEAEEGKPVDDEAVEPATPAPPV